MREISSLVEDLLASQKEICCMELISQFVAVEVLLQYVGTRRAGLTSHRNDPHFT
jgi:hypothetical protein